ncbi:MAG: prepilin-type N-terminal cleavage/methylation domain-containing protein [Comamonadaceae bacterium]|nr:MAG: prepilin-type N-terminal cleavage/methylation domain-containing protein [Comamonadaceae bacterium]
MFRLETRPLLEMKMNNRSRASVASGFTLIELMVTLALLSALMLVAVPSFIGFRKNSELTSTANNFVAALSAARGEAMKRSVPAIVIPASGTDWSTGWIAFVDTDFDGAYSSSIDTLIMRNDEALPSYLTMTAKTGANANATSVKYNGSGYNVAGAGFADLTFEIKNTQSTGTDALAQTRRVKVNVTGRARTCTPKTSSDSTCNAYGD